MQHSSEQQRSFAVRLNLVPEEPGVYLMKDDTGSVIYVGKALSLRSRLSSYFTAKPDGNAKVQAMIRRIDDFEIIVCSTELEALILEANLIKEYQPRYNILLRDDKEYPYIRVSLQNAFPKVEKSFHIEEDVKEGARYFGPWLNGDINRALDALQSIFPLRSCNRDLPRDIGKQRPCLNYYIGRCLGPCNGYVSEKDYGELVADVIRFLEGRYGELTQNLKAEMEAASDALEFERAAVLREKWQALRRLEEKQHIVDPQGGDYDAVAMERNGCDISLQKLEVRAGRVTGRVYRFAEDTGEADGNYLEVFLRSLYEQGGSIPPLILLSSPISNQELMGEYLSELRGGKVSLHVPQRGAKKATVDLAARNAQWSLMRHTLMGGKSAQDLELTLRTLAEYTGCTGYPQRIEAYDISSTGAEERTGAMVVFRDGRPERKSYRHFTIKSFEGIDDYRAMRELIERRLRHLQDENVDSRPDIIFIDGGLGHVNAVKDLLDDAGIAVAGIVKDTRHRTRGLVLSDGRTIELSQAAEDEDADTRALRLGVLRLLTALQDEAHRFANRLRNQQENKRRLQYQIESIPGVGPARRKLLLKEFGSIKKLSQA
ncbi:MAG: excinuclease ABC subunit UvrC, partial [Eubacteriales bacterium]|nr:excinuclease ABC subunit UvrC [Eubacteriales bacterium]